MRNVVHTFEEGTVKVEILQALNDKNQFKFELFHNQIFIQHAYVRIEDKTFAILGKELTYQKLVQKFLQEIFNKGIIL